MQQEYIYKEMSCSFCGVFMTLSSYKKHKDRWAWRCLNSQCHYYLECLSMRTNSFFEDFTTDFSFKIQVIIKFLTKTPINAIITFLRRDKRIIYKILNKFKSIIPKFDFSTNKLGGPGMIVQVDETMLNYKCKSHRGRSSTIRTDAISIVECNGGIVRAYARIIPNKEASTLIPIITSQVSSGSVIWTDDHRSYGTLSSLGYQHGFVTHKYEFVNHITGVNTQAVESFHNQMKLEIKNRKGIQTEERANFIKEFLFFFNYKEESYERGFELIKVN